jgi:diguanylate cyclase (GGDEF)-like protein
LIRRRRQVWGVPALLGALFAGYVCLPLDDSAQHIWYHVTAVLSMALGFWGLHVHRPAHLRGWVLVMSGFSGWVIGDLVWLVETWLAPARFPAPSDIVYLSSYAVLGAGVLAMVRTRRSGSDRAAFLDAAILTTGAAVLVTVFVIAPLTQDASLSGIAKLVSSAYPVGDVFLIAALARMLTSPGARNRSYRLLLAALGVTTATDSVWNVMVALSGDTISESRWLDAGWLCAYALVAVAASAPAMSLVTEPAPPSDALPFGRRRVVAMATGLLLPAVVLFTDGYTDDAVNWPVIAAGAVVMSVLVVARFVDLLATVQTQAVQLAALARTDPLTGAPNRRTWDHELSLACQFARSNHTRLIVAILDLDHFKAFNDTYGHQAGDQLLREAVATWTDVLPAGAILARYGGEEFALLLPGFRRDEAEKVLSVLKNVTPGGQTFSAGIAECRSNDTPSALIAAADEAMYLAKRNGRNRIVGGTGDDLGDLHTHHPLLEPSAGDPRVRPAGS